MVQTYRHFDRQRARAAFATDVDTFNSYNANKWVPTGTGTPANALATNGGLNLVTSAASGDSAIVQRGIETAATKLVSIPLRKGRKVSAIARFEHADFLNMDLAFGLAPALANPFTGSASVYAIIGSNTNSVVKGSDSYALDVAVTLAALRDKLGGIDFEMYWDGQSKLHYYAGGQRIGGFNRLVPDANGYVPGLTAPLAVSAGIISRSASAKTVLLRQIGSSVQLKPDLGVPAQQV